MLDSEIESVLFHENGRFISSEKKISSVDQRMTRDKTIVTMSEFL